MLWVTENYYHATIRWRSPFPGLHLGDFSCHYERHSIDPFSCILYERAIWSGGSLFRLDLRSPSVAQREEGDKRGYYSGIMQFCRDRVLCCRVGFHSGGKSRVHHRSIPGFHTSLELSHV